MVGRDGKNFKLKRKLNFFSNRAKFSEIPSRKQILYQIVRTVRGSFETGFGALRPTYKFYWRYRAENLNKILIELPISVSDEHPLY